MSAFSRRPSVTQQTHKEWNVKYQMLALLTAFAWGVGGYFEKRGMHLGGISPQLGAAMRTAVAFLILGTLSYSQWSTLTTAGPRAILYIVVGGGILAGAIGMLAFYTAIHGAPLSKVMPIAFTSPLFGAMMGLAFGGESFSWALVLGTTLTISGIFVLTAS